MLKIYLICAAVWLAECPVLHADPAMGGGPPVRKTKGEQSGGITFGSSYRTNMLTGSLAVPASGGLNIDRPHEGSTGSGLDITGSSRSEGQSLDRSLIADATNRPAPRSESENLLYVQDDAFKTNNAKFNLFSVEPKKKKSP